MANSTITINFEENVLPGKFVSFDIAKASGGAVFKTLRFDWGFFRNAKYIIPVLAYPINPSEPTGAGGYRLDAYLYQDYFNRDFNLLGVFTTQVIGNTITIGSVNNLYVFSNFQTDSVKAESVIDNQPILGVFKLTQDNLVASVDNENKVRFEFVASLNIKKYILDNQENFITENTVLNIEYLRGADFKIELIDSNNRSIFYPGQKEFTEDLTGKLLFQIKEKTIRYDKNTSENIIVKRTVNLSGATAVIAVLNKENLELQYSLDNNTYQTSNIFPNLIEGDYTVYVKDQFEFVAQKPFTITATSSRVSYANISKANPFQFIKLKEDDEVSNIENTFSSNGLMKLNFCNKTIFNSKDSTNIQVKSSYDNIVSKIRFESGNETVFNMIKKSNNLDRYEKMDCFYYRHSSGKLGVYFVSGSTYNSLDVVIGQYELNGNLPLFAKAGNKVEIDGVGAFTIHNIVIDKDINKKVILFDTIYSGLLVNSKIACLYDLLNYDIYEYNFNFQSFEVGLCDIVIEFNNEETDKVIYQSENIEIIEEHDNSLEILSFNDYYNNRDVFYKFDIKFFSRYYYSTIETYTKEESEININDDNINSIKSSVTFGEEYLFEDLTRKQMEHLSIILSSEFVFINDIGYLKDGDLNIENEKNTNIYSIKAKMIRTGESYSTQETIYSGSDELTEEIYVPRIITDGTNLIKS